MSTFTILWAVLLGIFGVGFGVLEGIALSDKVKGNTLSETLRCWLHTDTKVGRSIWAVVWGLFAVLFLVHILSPGLIFW